MPTLVVDVVVENENITVSPTTLHASIGDNIQWQAFGAGAFTLAFRDGGVIDLGGAAQVRSGGGGVNAGAIAGSVHGLLAHAMGGGGPVATGRAAVTGTHPYQIAVYQGGHVYMDTSCPEVIIR